MIRLHVLSFLAANPYGLSANDFGIPNPGNGGSTLSVGGVVVNVIKLLMALVGMFSVIFLLVGALQMVYSTGNASRIQRARETLMYAVVGLVVAIGAYAFVDFVSHSVG